MGASEHKAVRIVTRRGNETFAMLRGASEHKAAGDVKNVGDRLLC